VERGWGRSRLIRLMVRNGCTIIAVSAPVKACVSRVAGAVILNRLEYAAQNVAARGRDGGGLFLALCLARLVARRGVLLMVCGRRSSRGGSAALEFHAATRSQVPACCVVCHDGQNRVDRYYALSLLLPVSPIETLLFLWFSLCGLLLSLLLQLGLPRRAVSLLLLLLLLQLLQTLALHATPLVEEEGRVRV
jgi:hypothetical protein